MRGCLKSGPKDLNISQVCHPMGSVPFPFKSECPKLPAQAANLGHFQSKIFKLLISSTSFRATWLIFDM